MRPDIEKSVTLLELILCIVLMSMVILGFYSIDMFSHRQVLSTDRKSKLQNEAAYVLNHISKTLMTAVGDVAHRAVDPTDVSGMTSTIIVHNDSTPDGAWDPVNDAVVSYTYDLVNTIDFTDSSGTTETLSRHVKSFNANLIGSTVTVNITACWDPAETGGKICGSTENPSFNLTNAITIPAFSSQ
jgi:hypothetical protein